MKFTDPQYIEELKALRNRVETAIFLAESSKVELLATATEDIGESAMALVHDTCISK